MINTQPTLKFIKEMWQYSNTGKQTFNKIFTVHITIWTSYCQFSSHKPLIFKFDLIPV